MTKTKDLTSGPPTRLIILFTLPLVVGNVFQQAYQFTDTAVVGRLLGVEQLAAVGATSGICFLLLGFTFGATGGLAIPIAKAFGAGDMDAMRRHVAAGITVAGAMAAVITAIGLIGARPILRALHTPPELVDGSAEFLTVTFAGAVTMVAFNFLAATIRALGDSRTPLYFLIVSCVLNAGLVVVFIALAHLGVGGAAGATITAQGVSAAFCLWLVRRRFPELRLRRTDWNFQPGEFAESARMGITMGFQLSIVAIGSLVLQYAINGLGSDAVAAYTVSMRVDMMAVAPLQSIGLGMATYVAQNRGARQWPRIRVGVFRMSLVSAGVALVMGAVIVLFGIKIVGLFVGADEPDVLAMSHQFLLVNGPLYAFLAMVFFLRNTVQGLGNTTVPTIAGFLELIIRSAVALLLVPHLGFLACVLAGPSAWIGALLVIAPAWFYHRKDLKRKEADAARPIDMPLLAEPSRV